MIQAACGARYAALGEQYVQDAQQVHVDGIPVAGIGHYFLQEPRTGLLCLRNERATALAGTLAPQAKPAAARFADIRQPI
ncbi:hypothetical protein GCM10027046_11550 [Uliginosibacterium flavum]